MRIHCLQHMVAEGPGLIADWAAQRGYSLTSTPWFAPAALLPLPEQLDLLVVLGGAMSVHDEVMHPWLRQEKAFLQAVLAANRPVLGICLGAQLLAQALGAEVGPQAAPEVGVFPVWFTGEARQRRLFRHAPEMAPVLHWHADAFSLPPGAVAVASSEATVCQGFVVGERVVGLQFHPEANEPLLEAMIQAEGEDLVPSAHVQTVPEVRAGFSTLTQRTDLLFPLLDALVGATVAG